MWLNRFGFYSWLIQRGQRIEFVCHLLTDSDQVRDKPQIQVKQTFIFAKVSGVVTFGKHTPDLRTQAQRMRQELKNDVAIA